TSAFSSSTISSPRYAANVRPAPSPRTPSSSVAVRYVIVTSPSPTSSRRTPTGICAWCHVSSGRRAASSGLARGYGARPPPQNATPRRNGFASTFLQLHRIREFGTHDAVHDEGAAGDVGREVAAQEQDRGCDVVGLGDPSQRSIARLQLPAAIAEQ